MRAADYYGQRRRPGAEFEGDEKISIFRPKISGLFLVIDKVFQILHFFTLLNVVYDPFFTRKTTISKKNSLIRPFSLYSVRTFARIRQHYFSKYWGDQCMGRPQPQILGGPSPQSSLGLRSCLWTLTNPS